MRVIFSIVFLTFTLSAICQIKDNEAQNILNALRDKYEMSPSLTLSFNMKWKQGEKETSHKGTFLKKAKKYKIKFDVNEIINDGTAIYAYDYLENQLTISDAEEETDEMLTPSKILSLYSNGAMEYAITDKQKNGTNEWIYKIELKENNEFSDFFKYRIEVNLGKNEIERLMAFSNDGSKLDISFSKTDIDSEIKESIFIFNEKKYKGIQIEDLRF